MRMICKNLTILAFSMVATLSSFQAISVEIIGGGGHAAEKLLLNWGQNKQEGRANAIRFSDSINSGDLNSLQNKKIDFAILDYPLGEAELNKRNLIQIPFVLSGVSIVVNRQLSLAGTLRLDSQTLGKIFSGEITQWDDPEIIALNPKHDLPNKPIIIIYSAETSNDYSVISSYLGNINDKWKSDELAGKPRTWPSNAVFTDSIKARSAAVTNTSYSISYLPMQYISTTALAPVHIRNKDGRLIGLSDTSILSSASTVNIDDNSIANLSLINKSGSGSWPISNFEFLVFSKEIAKDDNILQLLNIVSNGLKFDTVKPTLYNFVSLSDQSSKIIISKIEAIIAASSKGLTKTSATLQGDTQEQAASRKRAEDELKAKQRPDSNTAQDLIRQNEIRKAEEKARLDEKNRAEERAKAEERARAAKLAAEEAARNEAIREAKAAKLAAEEAIRAAKAAKLAADEIVEKNNQLAKAAKEKADKEKAIEQRNQKDEDPLSAYRRSIQ
jgi:phosphate transport system substrate-binding protein